MFQVKHMGDMSVGPVNLHFISAHFWTCMANTRRLSPVLRTHDRQNAAPTSRCPLANPEPYEYVAFCSNGRYHYMKDLENGQ